MATLNELNDITKKNIYLLCTYKCSRNCEFCCNKQYDILKDVPIVSYKEFEVEYLRRRFDKIVYEVIDALKNKED